jgi:transposase-like protein
MEQHAKPHAPARRRHLPEFKARVINECAQPGASVAAVALSHGLHANLVHSWRRQARQADFGFEPASTAAAAPQPLTPSSGGAPVAPSTVTAKIIHAPGTGTPGNPGNPGSQGGKGGKGSPTGTFIALAPPTVAALDLRTAPTTVDQAHSIHIDILRTQAHTHAHAHAHTHVHIRWPTSAASDCALWLKDLLHDPPQDPYQGPRADVPRRGAPK